jgi:hypothetical protein
MLVTLLRLIDSPPLFQPLSFLCPFQRKQKQMEPIYHYGLWAITSSSLDDRAGGCGMNYTTGLGLLRLILITKSTPKGGLGKKKAVKV